MIARILMCPPDHYGIEYEINPWMSRQRPSDRAVASEQVTALKQQIEAAGARVEQLEPVAGLPDLVFTANAALIYRQEAILARFRHEVRQREVPHDEAWLRAAGFQIRHVPEGVSFEGAGDALFCGDTLFAGYRMRSDARGHQQIGEVLGVRVIPVELIDPYYYHLDTCFCPLNTTSAIYYPGAFDEYGLRALQGMVETLIEVSELEARRFACNAVVIGQTVITTGLRAATRRTG